MLESRLALLGEKAAVAFLKKLPKHRRYSFEFRHPSWYTSKIFSLLSELLTHHALGLEQADPELEKTGMGHLRLL